MKNITKSSLFFAFFTILLIFFLSFSPLPLKTKAATEPIDGYVLRALNSKADGKAVSRFELFLKYDHLLLSENAAKLKENLNDMVNEFLNSEKQFLQTRPAAAQDFEEITFGQVQSNTVMNCFSYEIEFQSFEQYSAYYGNIERKENNQLFTSFLVQSAYSPFLLNFQQEDLKNYYLNSILKVFSQNEATFSSSALNLSFIFDMCTSNQRMKSNSDEIGLDEEGNFHHLWFVDDFDETQVMKLTLTTANRGWWYLIGLTVPLLLMAVAIIIVQSKKFLKTSNK